MNPLLLTFYGDDFTGSADAMEALTINGVKTALFLGHPSTEQISQKGTDLQAVGISGISRTMTPEQMDGELPRQFSLLDSLGAPLIHYKVCATFDSSPTIGSIGHAADTAFRVLEPSCGVIVQGVPLLGRYIASHQAMGLLNLRSANRAVAGAGPGPEGAMTKLILSELGHEAAAILTELNGPDAAFMDGPGAMSNMLVLMHRGMSIAGGTSEIKRNQIGERILGLPRDPLIR